MLLYEILAGASARAPDKRAVWQPGGPAGTWTTYAQLDARARALAARLRQRGLEPGDRVATILDNGPDWIVAHFAVLRAGGVVVPLSAELDAPSLVFALRDAGARFAIVEARLLELLHAKPELGELTSIVLDAPAELEAELGADPHAGHEDDLAAIIYTSGSTGRPKGVMLSHRNLLASARATVKVLELTERDRVLVVLPLCYIYGLSQVYTHFLAGGSLLLDDRFAYPNVVLDTLVEHEATGFAGVPATFMFLLRRSNLRHRKLSSLRYVTQAGGALAPALQQELAGVIAPARLFVMYGATEAGPRMACRDPGWVPQKWGSVGRAMPDVELTVVDEEGRPLPVGETGELVARGPNIMMGYWNDPDGTAAVLRDGRYFTGDLATRDADGCISIVGRKRDIVKVGGQRVSPREIEELLLEIPGVAEAAVVGVEDPVLGEALSAFIVPVDRGGLEAARVRGLLKERLPSFKVPKVVHVIESLPKSSNGKVLKGILRGIP